MIKCGLFLVFNGKLCLIVQLLNVRLLSGVTSDIIIDAGINGLIAFSDQQVDGGIQVFVSVPTLFQ